MTWLEICINTVSEGIEPLCDRLIALGIESFSVEDETQLHEFLEQNRAAWDYIDEEFMRSMRGVSRVKLYVPDNDEGHSLLHAVERALVDLRADRPDVELGSLELVSSVVDDEDWGESWKRFFKSFPIGRRMRIRPRWEPPAEDDDRTELIIDPGMLFGSGTHSTTQLCLELLEDRISGGETVLDLGCGSGILSIMSLLLGAGSVTAVDIDPNAPAVVNANAQQNGFTSDRYNVHVGNILENGDLQNVLSEKRYDIITANIVADVIIALSPFAVSLLSQSGVFIASGIIDTRADEVLQAVTREGLKLLTRRESEGWVAFEFERTSDIPSC